MGSWAGVNGRGGSLSRVNISYPMPGKLSPQEVNSGGKGARWAGRLQEDFIGRGGGPPCPHDSRHGGRRYTQFGQDFLSA